MAEQQKTQGLSCADCHVNACKTSGTGAPTFCPAAAWDSGVLDKTLEVLKTPEANRIAVAAAQVEYEGYGAWSRVEDTIAFARKLGVEKIGIAACVGLADEARTLTKILRTQGFEVLTVSCKAGSVPKREIGIDASCETHGVYMCNPVFQAEFLNRKDTALNIVLGLCVGHDSLFYQYSKAPCTTLVAKDRVTGHNPAVPLYQTASYFKRLLEKGNPIPKTEQ